MTYSKADLQRDAGIPHEPTDLTYDCRMAISGEGPRAHEWADKPHRLVYDLCRKVERMQNLIDAYEGMMEFVIFAKDEHWDSLKAAKEKMP